MANSFSTPLIATVLSLASTLPLLSQPPLPDPAPFRDAIERVSFLVGEWEGEGWMAFGPNQRSTFRSWERVQEKLDGSALLVEGRHWSRQGEEERLIYNALAVISWDPPQQRYRFTSFLANRPGGDFPARVLADGAFEWSMEAGPRKIRYTLRIDDQGRWSELGEMSTDGESWRQFFAMTLARVGD